MEKKQPDIYSKEQIIREIKGKFRVSFVSQQTGLSERTIFNFLKDGSNPQYKTLIVLSEFIGGEYWKSSLNQPGKS